MFKAISVFAIMIALTFCVNKELSPMKFAHYDGFYGPSKLDKETWGDCPQGFQIKTLDYKEEIIDTPTAPTCYNILCNGKLTIDATKYGN